MERLDCLIIHVPNFNDKKYLPHNIIRNILPVQNPTSGSSISLMPIGTFPIADCLTKEGYNVKILNLAVEKNWRNTLTKLLSTSPRLIAFSLQWAFAIKSFIKISKYVKKLSGSSSIAVGGFSASYFHKSLLKTQKHIDYIIKGDSEKPIIQLMKNIKSKSQDFSKVENLTWRSKNGIIHSNKISYIASDKDIDKLNFTNFNPLINYKKYMKTNLYFPNSKKNKIFYTSLGRGCPVNCSICGGSKFSQCLINNRKNICRMSTDKAIEMLNNAKNLGFNKAYISFDPYPHKTKYYHELFTKMNKEKIDIDICFESWGLPNKEFIKSYNKIYNNNSYITISPFSGSEKIRKINRGYYYNNQAFNKIFRELDKKSICFKTCYATRLPYEKITDLKKTIKFEKNTRNRYKYNIQSEILPLQLDIGSLAFQYPKKYKVKLLKNKFNEFYKSNISLNLNKLINIPAKENTFYKSMTMNDFKMIYYLYKNKKLFSIRNQQVTY